MRCGSTPASPSPRIPPRSPSRAPRSPRLSRTSSACAAARRRTTWSTLPPAISLPSSLSQARALISTVRAKAFARHSVIPEPPEEPLPSSCCERGCDRCVFSIHYEALRRFAAASLVLACAVPDARATDLPDTDVVVITAPRTAGRADAASQGTVSGEALEHRPLARPADLLEAVPGMAVTQHSGGGKANQYFLRGFNLDHGTDFAVQVDGMPVNLPSHAHGQGYADLNFLIPELVDHIHYRKGPYYADQGDFSAAGAAHLHLRRSLPSAFSELTAGSYGYRRALIGGNRELGDANLLGALELGAANGPWEHAEGLRKLNPLGRYEKAADRDGLIVTATA